MVMKLDHEDLNRLIEKISTSDIQEFSLEGEDFKLEIKRNLSDQNQFNNLVSNNSIDRQTIDNQKPKNDNTPRVMDIGSSTSKTLPLWKITFTSIPSFKYFAPLPICSEESLVSSKLVISIKT